MTSDNQHLKTTLEHKIARKWERKIKNRSATRESSRSSVIDSVATSEFWREKDEHIKISIASKKIVMMPTGNTTTASDKLSLPN